MRTCDKTHLLVVLRVRSYCAIDIIYLFKNKIDVLSEEASIIELHDSLEFMCEKYLRKDWLIALWEMSLLDCN